MNDQTKFSVLVGSMEPRSHWPGKEKGEAFDFWKSEVCQWLMGQPVVWEWVFRIVQGRRLILYDEQSGKWVGRDTFRGLVLRQSEPVEAQALREAGSAGGRPNKVKEISAMDLTGWYESEKEWGGLRAVSRSLVRWLAGQGMKASLPTCMRVVKGLVNCGQLRVVRARIAGRADDVRPAPAPG